MFRIKLVITALTLVLFSCGKEAIENNEVVDNVEKRYFEISAMDSSGPYCNKFGAFYHLHITAGIFCTITHFVHVYEQDGSYKGAWLMPPGCEANIGFDTWITQIQGQYQTTELKDCSILNADETYLYKISNVYQLNPAYDEVATPNIAGEFATDECVCTV